MSERILSEYARLFNEKCICWNEDWNQNILYLRSVENCFNNIYQRTGTLLLNDVYKYLGIPEEDKYRNVGWKKDLEWSDGFICFDLDMYAQEGPIILDFNVDGMIDYDF
jgi:hypothetical protein